MKKIIFDFDGTLADSFETLLGLFGEITGRQQKLTAEEINKLRGSSIRQIMKHLKVRPWQIPRLALRAKRLMGPKIKDIKTFPELPAVIKDLHRDDYEMFILSTNSPDNISAFLKTNGLDSYFIRIYGDIALLRKSAALRKIIKQEKWAAKDVIYVGDEQRDVEAAHRAGIRIVAVSWGFNYAKVLEQAKPDALATTPQALLRLLRNT